MPRKKCVITGATGGIGSAIASECVRQGMDVALIGRSKTKLNKMKDSLCLKLNNNQTVLTEMIESISEKEIKKCIQKVENRLKGIDVLINCIGCYKEKKLSNTTLEDWNELIESNVTSIFLFTKYALSALKKSKGIIINFSSIGGQKGLRNKAAYCASKFALSGFTKSIAKELKQDNIKVHSVFPYLVDTKNEVDWEKNPDEDVIVQTVDIAKNIIHLINLPSRVLIEEMHIKPFAY